MKETAPPVALITGASRGLGAFLAWELARDGYAVGIHHRGGKGSADRLVRLIRKESGIAELFYGDLAIPAQVDSVFRKVRARFGRIDVLVNNTGTYRPVPLLRARVEDWRTGLDSTATATFLAIRAALPLFPKTGGRIVNLGDSACEKLTARKMAPGYHVGKVGVHLLTRSFAAQLIRRKITVNTVSPGYLENSIDLPPSGQLPSNRPVRFSEVASAIRYLLSREADQVTGSNLIISGGWNL
ncbi:SDR family oxidoreductase [bacterium]|nr:SDR family oxidoreductase [bacterium]